MSIFSNLDVNLVIELTKHLFENSRCSLCEKSGGTHMTYPCGHTACDECLSVSDTCLFCITPPGKFQHPVYDPVLTKRVQNATNLLNKCQETFNVDVYKRQRLSHQFKIEKEIFPKCIQAPLKYFNRNKSFSRSAKNIENCFPLLPGENINSLNNNKMENSVNFVEQWLQKNEKNLKRQPLASINTNDSRIFNLNASLNKKQSYESPKHNRKRCKFGNIQQEIKNQENTVKPQNETIRDDTSKSPKQRKRDLITELKSTVEDDNDESGIVIDDDVIVIGDSQTTVDKDANALLAVIEANRNILTSPTIGSPEKLPTVSIKQTLSGNCYVPFYKRSKLTETCALCNNLQPIKFQNNPSNVSVTIENNNFTTIISIDTNQNVLKSKEKQSALVQTDISDMSIVGVLSKNYIDVGISEKQTVTEEDNSTRNSPCHETSINEMKLDKNHTNKSLERTCVVIEESDSDSDLECTTVEVAADIHRSNQDLNGVLTEIEDYEEHSKRLRRGPRGNTPNSSDSSDKENFNPNRQKRGKDYKNKCKK